MDGSKLGKGGKVEELPIKKEVIKDFDFLRDSLELAKDLVQSRIDPKRAFSEASFLARDLNSMVSVLPRQIKQGFRRFNDPDFAWRVQMSEIDGLGRSIETSAWILAGALILSSLILGLLLRS